MSSQTTTEQLLPVYRLPKIVNPELEVCRLSENFIKHNITFTATNGVGHCRGIFTASDSYGECVLYVLYDGYFVIPNPRIFSYTEDVQKLFGDCERLVRDALCISVIGGAGFTLNFDY